MVTTAGGVEAGVPRTTEAHLPPGPPALPAPALDVAGAGLLGPLEAVAVDLPTEALAPLTVGLPTEALARMAAFPVTATLPPGTPTAVGTGAGAPVSAGAGAGAGAGIGPFEAAPADTGATTAGAGAGAGAGSALATVGATGLPGRGPEAWAAGAGMLEDGTKVRALNSNSCASSRLPTSL